MKSPEAWQPSTVHQVDGIWQPNFDRIAPWSKHVVALESDAYVSILSNNVRGDVLEVGAGTMPYFAVYQEYADTITATDWSNSIHDISHIDILADANQGLPFKSESFDTVIVADVIEHISNPGKLFEDINLVLRPQGKLVLFCPFLYGIHEAPHDYHRYTAYQLGRLCAINELSNVAISPYGGGPDVLIDLIEKMTYKTKYLRHLARLASVSFIKTNTYKKAQSQFKDRFPIGYSLVAQKVDG